jgi:serine phosphatase RsbU (regulator of sigma subunit)
MWYPRGDSGDAAAKKSVEDSLTNVEALEPGAFLGAAIFDTQDRAYVFNLPYGPPPTAGSSKSSGQTQISDVNLQGHAGRAYRHPMHDRENKPAGSAVVILSTASIKAFPLPAVAAAAAGLAFVGGLIAASILAGGTKKAMAQLAADTDSLVRGNFEVRVSMQGPAAMQQIAKNVQKLAGLAQSGASAPAQVMVQEVVRAPVQEISEALAPGKSFQRVDELEIEATQKLCAELGNDYYDIVNVDDEHVGVFVADVPVRGAKSSMHMAAVRALFRANAKGQTSPAEVLKAVNRGFAVDLPRGVYVTAMYALVSRTSGLCKVASANHLPLVFWKMSKKASARLAPEGIALGLDPGPVFDKTITEKAIQLDKGDRIMLYTDGAINGKNPAGAQYGEERFYYVVNREAPKNSAACVNFVANDVDLFHEGAPLTDDFTLVTVRRMR